MSVKATKTPLGYTLSLDGKSVFAERQPDLYFVIDLDGQKHKGYLKNLKDVFSAWAQGVPAGATVAVDIENQEVDLVAEVVEDKIANGVGRKRKKYTSEGSNVATDEDQDDPLPIIGTDAELVGEDDTREIRVHTPSKRFPYPDGYAMIEKATRIQHGWTKDRSRALESLKSK
jgi:hypothetical protein